MDNPFKSPAVISFCPGILGIERGLKRAGVHPRVMAYVEIEAYICANLVAGMEAGLLDPAPIWTDAKTFPREYFFRRIHGIIGGYPCTPFSLAGQRKGESDDRHLWPYISAAISSIEPLWCFFENVDDHLSMGFDIVYKDLQRMGYSVETGIYTAEEVGAPHERERMFILAITNSIDWGLSESKGWIEEIQTAGCGKELANAKRAEWREIITGNQGNQQYDVQREGQENSIGFEQCGQELVNPSGVTERKQADETNTQSGEREAWQKSGQRREQLADFVCPGLEIGREQSTRKEQQAIERSGITRWPARPGEEQHDWEEPRTIEPGLGCTIDGYNFREDLLRALGNSVVEQTAELAFIDLLKKHLKNARP